jgi:hypothetical protein
MKRREKADFASFSSKSAESRVSPELLVLATGAGSIG